MIRKDIKIDKAFILFYSSVMEVAEKEFSASCEAEEGSEEFAKKLHQEYLTAGSPEDLKAWIKERLRGVYSCVTTPPRWIEEEPHWPFHDGQPMVFITQASLTQNEVTENRLTWDTEVYLFGARVPLGKGYRVVYRVVEQDEFMKAFE